MTILRRNGGFIISPEMRALIEKAKASGGTVQCDPRMMYPVGHECAARTNVRGAPIIADEAILLQTTKPRRNGGAVVELQTATDNVTATTDANGAVTKVEVRNKWLVPAALVGAFFLFGG